MARFHRLLAVLVLAAVAASLAGCGGGGQGSLISPPDLSPPPAVTGFSATYSTGTVILSWSKPRSADFRGVLVRRGTGAFPTDAGAAQTTSDKIVCSTTGETCSDASVDTNEWYYYSAFTYDESSNYSSPATASTTTALPYTFIALPDTQYYNLDYPALLNTMTTWAADNVDELNIAAVLHEGDITHKNTDDEWENAVDNMSELDGYVPYFLCPGNHDDDGDRDTTLYNHYFPVSKFEVWPEFGGIYEDDKLDNAYYNFTAGGIDWTVIALEYDPRDGALEWADGIAESIPERRIIVLTHAYLAPDGDRSSIGNNIWNSFARKHENVTFVLNGHYTDGYASRLVSTGDNGNKVYQMFANYQTMTFGGLGYLRVVTLDPADRRVTVKTYSPYRQKYLEDEENQFTFEDVELGPPGGGS